MKKVLLIVLVFVVFVGTIVFLGYCLYNTNAALSAAEADIAGMTFTEGKVIEGDTGGLITVSLKKAVYFESDEFVTDTKPAGNLVENIFCELHKSGFVDSFSNNLAKIKYSKQIIVKEGGTEKCYFLVGDYYIAIQK